MATKSPKKSATKPNPASPSSSPAKIPAWKKLKLARQKRFAKFNPRTQIQNLRRSFIGMRRGER